MDEPITPYPTSPPLTPPRIVVSIQEKKFQIVHTGSTVRYHCSGRSLDNVCYHSIIQVYLRQCYEIINNSLQNPLHIRWEKEGGRLPDRSLDDSQGLLIIRDVKVSDSGVYICQVSDGLNLAVEKVTLTVGGLYYY